MVTKESMEVKQSKRIKESMKINKSKVIMDSMEIECSKEIKDSKEKAIQSENKTVKRKYYIDNLRWFCILLLIPYHVAMAWNCWGEDTYIRFEENRIMGSLITIVSPWYMPLLFVLAGMSLYYSLQKRTISHVIRERILKVALPLLSGIVLVVPFMTYYSMKFHNGFDGNILDAYKVFFTKYTDLTGNDGGFTPAHLWFLLYLLLISLVVLVIIAIQKKLFPKLIENTHQLLNIMKDRQRIILIYACGIIPVIGTPILDFGGKSFGMYMSLFIIGYFLFSEEKVVYTLEKYMLLSAVITIAASIADTYLFIWSENSYDFLNTICMYLCRWFGILTLIGFGKKYFNGHNKFRQYLTERSFMIYIFHYIWVIILQYWINQYTDNICFLFIISVLGGYVLTLINIEVIIRIPGVRMLFGFKIHKRLCKYQSNDKKVT